MTSLLLIAPVLAAAAPGASLADDAALGRAPTIPSPRDPNAACEPGVGCLPETPGLVDERGDTMTGPLEMAASLVMLGNQADLLDPLPGGGPVELILEGGTRQVVQAGAQILVEPGAEARIANGATLVIEVASGLALPQAALEVPGNVLPAETNTFALGSPALRWTDLFLDSQINYLGDLEFVAEDGVTTMVLTPAGDLTVIGTVGDSDQQQIDELRATVDALNAQVAELQAQATTYQGQIDKLAAILLELRGRVK